MPENLKPGGGGLLQPYNDDNGEYTDKPYESFEKYCKRISLKAKEEESRVFCKKFKATKEELLESINRDSIDSIVMYSMHDDGVNLNSAIRNGTLTEIQSMHVNNIVDAVNNHRLVEPLQLYRGIAVTEEVFKNEFVYYLNNNLSKIGSTICSTSRSFARAKLAAMPTEDKPISIIFDIETPRNYPGLPIEDIAVQRSEQEVLLASPKYKIVSMNLMKSGKFEYYKVIIVLEGEKV